MPDHIPQPEKPGPREAEPNQPGQPEKPVRSSLGQAALRAARKALHETRTTAGRAVRGAVNNISPGLQRSPEERTDPAIAQFIERTNLARLIDKIILSQRSRPTMVKPALSELSTYKMTPSPRASLVARIASACSTKRLKRQKYTGSSQKSSGQRRQAARLLSSMASATMK